MENKYKELFDKIVPPKSDEELLCAILDGKAENMNKKKRFNKLTIIIPAIAAAVLLCTTVGVSAAYSWDIPAALNGIFNKTPKSRDGKVFFEFNDFDFSEFGGKVLDQRFECDGYTVQMKGVFADKHTALVLYDVILDEGHVFTSDYGDYSYRKGDRVYVTLWQDYRNYNNLLNKHLDQNRNPDGTYNFEKSEITEINSHEDNYLLEKEEGNIFHCALRHDLKVLTFKDNEIVYNLVGLTVGNYIEDVTKVLSENGYKNKLVIDFDFIKENDEKRVDGNVPFSLDSGECGAITSVQMTSLTLDVDIDWEKDKGPFENGIDKAYHEVKVRFKNGTVADNYILWNQEFGNITLDYSKWDRQLLGQKLYLSWKYPVKVSEIDAIIIGDGEFKVN